MDHSSIDQPSVWESSSLDTSSDMNGETSNQASGQYLSPVSQDWMQFTPIYASPGGQGGLNSSMTEAEQLQFAALHDYSQRLRLSGHARLQRLADFRQVAMSKMNSDEVSSILETQQETSYSIAVGRRNALSLPSSAVDERSRLQEPRPTDEHTKAKEKMYASSMVEHHRMASDENVDFESDFHIDFLPISRIVHTHQGSFKFYGFDQRPFCENPHHWKEGPQHRLELHELCTETRINGMKTSFIQSPDCASSLPVPMGCVKALPDRSIVFRDLATWSEVDWGRPIPLGLYSQETTLPQPILPIGWALTQDGPSLENWALMQQDQLPAARPSESGLIWAHSTSTRRILMSRQQMRGCTEQDDGDLELATMKRGVEMSQSSKAQQEALGRSNA